MICIYDIKLFLVEVVENIYLEPGKFLRPYKSYTINLFILSDFCGRKR